MYSFPRCHTQSKGQAVVFQIALILSAWHSCISLRRTMWFHASSFNMSIMTLAWSARVPTQGPLASESCFLLVSFRLVWPCCLLGFLATLGPRVPSPLWSCRSLLGQKFPCGLRFNFDFFRFPRRVLEQIYFIS